eukprot:CAMPEP_0117423420 /NCGR_PEP_ID=MMETSP0758-20121206/4042_1 /TAXON_ID=63605 /ORGANISM="Percolomonas cosmopolitus, Strain AE-1 (ATCC 50343)" /LENGTH=876 /DNA_ID=CAMNT_0005206587 /DNA_START=916 /DNA_END=3546 /DNA_ORIENTATION=-
MLVTDLVGFTKFSSSISAKKLLHILNRHFSVFDGLTLDLGLEKIKTVGDAYLCLDFNTKNGTRNAAILGLKLVQKLSEMNKIFNENFQIRIGIAYDKCIVGVLGSGKITFDVFGPAKLTAELMEQTSKPNRIHVTQEVYEKIYPWFILEEDDDEDNFNDRAYFIKGSKMNLDDLFEIVAYGTKEAKEKIDIDEDDELYRDTPPFEPLPMTLKLSERHVKNRGTKKLEKELVSNLKRLEQLNYDQYHKTKTENTLSHQKSRTSLDILIEKPVEDEFDDVGDTKIVDVDYAESTISGSGLKTSLADYNFKKPHINILTLMPSNFKQKVAYYRSTYAHQMKTLRAMGIAFACLFLFSSLFSMLHYYKEPAHMYSATMITNYIITLIVIFISFMFCFPCINRFLEVGLVVSLIYALSVIAYIYSILGHPDPNVMTDVARMNIISILFAISMLTVLPYLIKILFFIVMIPFVVLVSIYGTFVINTLLEFFAVCIFCYVFISYNFHRTLVAFFIAEVTMKNGVKLLKQESERSEALLRSSLPDNIIKRVYQMAEENASYDATTTTTSSSQGTVDIYDDIRNGYVMFVKVDGFEKIQNAKLAVEMLNDIYTWFDVFCDHLNIQKIKSIGGTYLCSSTNSKSMAECAILFTQVAQSHFKIYESKLRKYIKKTFTPSTPSHSYLRIFGNMNMENIDELIGLKIGINRGSIAAGVLGKSKFLYDIFGDTVNLASRMCTLAHRNQIQITSSIFEELKNEFVCVKRGTIKVKGKGEMETYYLLNQKIQSILASPLSPLSPKAPPQYRVSKAEENRRSQYALEEEQLQVDVSKPNPFSRDIIEDHLAKTMRGYYEETPSSTPLIDGTTPSMLFSPEKSFQSDDDDDDDE